MSFDALEWSSLTKGVEQMDVKDILGFAIDRASAINDYWNLYIAVATAIVGIMASGKLFTRNRSLKVFLTISFVVFAYSNLTAMLRLGVLRRALLDMLPADMMDLHQSLAPARPLQYIGFHGLLDLLVVAAIWFVPWPGGGAEGRRGSEGRPGIQV